MFNKNSCFVIFASPTAIMSKKKNLCNSKDIEDHQNSYQKNAFIWSKWRIVLLLVILS